MMIRTVEELGAIVRILRKRVGKTQEEIAVEVKTNRSVIAHLEQGRRLPEPIYLERICVILGIDKSEWEHFGDEHSVTCIRFEKLLSELTGRTLSLHMLGKLSRKAAERNIYDLFEKTLSDEQRMDMLNRILVSYGVTNICDDFYREFLKGRLSSTEEMDAAVSEYHKKAIRLFGTFREAFVELNIPGNVKKYLKLIEKKDLTFYKNRDDWDGTNLIPDNNLDLLGYISAERIKQEKKDRQFLYDFLVGLAKEISKDGPMVINDVGVKIRTKVDTLLREFDTKLPHGVFSPLFAPDPDEIVREAERIGPKKDEEIDEISNVQNVALMNLANYITADYMDVYVATSMRTNGDFVSVNDFVNTLFSLPKVKELKLRYFNPTQSWIEDRVAKGLVEALMLKRASITIYMAQKSDTFGKDSEASVALGQGKPVIVFVPKLYIANYLDSEELIGLPKSDLVSLLGELDLGEIDADSDEQAMTSRIIESKLVRMADEELCDLMRDVWSDFDLYSEVHRITNPDGRKEYRAWLDNIIQKDEKRIPKIIRDDAIGILVAVTINFEKRAKVFREIHPLALQVILSSGVLNGILVVRSVKQCGDILVDLLENDLKLSLNDDKDNYRLIETKTNSTIRVISKNKLIRNAFGTFYRRPLVGPISEEL